MARVFRPLLLLLMVVLLTGCNRKTEILSGIDERQANNIISFLSEQGIPATKSPTAQQGAAGATSVPTWTISVSKGQATEALIILSRNGLPRRPVVNILDVFQKSGLVSSDSEELIRYQQALGEQIAGTIEQIDGILQAVVQVSFPPPTQALGMGAETAKIPVRASVYVKHQGVLDDPNSQLISKIQRLVAASVTDLDYRNVTVVPDRARFSDTLIESMPDGMPDESRNYVLVWSMVIAKESIGRFRLIFFILCLFILMLIGAFSWLLWRLYPALQAAGGMRALFTGVHPIEEAEKAEEEEEEEIEEEL